MEGTIYNSGFNYEVASADNVEKAAQRSQHMRAPKKDPKLDGKETANRIRPFWVVQYCNRLTILEESISKTQKKIDGMIQNIQESPNSIYLVLLISLIVIADGFLLGPVISNIIETYESDLARMAVGISVALLLALLGWAIGFAIGALLQARFAKLIAVLLAGIAGAIAGAVIGYSGDGTKAGMLIRSILTTASLMSMAALHFRISESQEAWGPIRVIRKHLRKLSLEHFTVLNELRRYQEACISEEEAHNRREAARIEGLNTGKQAREEGVRMSYVRKRMASWFDKVFSVVLAILIISVPTSALADTSMVIVDVSDSIHDESQLIGRAVEETPLNYGDKVEAFTLGCNGLLHMYSGQVLPTSKPRHRQNLQQVKNELFESFQQEINPKNKKCSPLVDSLMVLAIDIEQRLKQGEKISITIATDFLANKNRIRLKEQPFAGVKVIAVLPPARGRNVSKRQKAISLAKELFKGAELTFAY